METFLGSLRLHLCSPVALNYSPQGDGNITVMLPDKSEFPVALNYSPQGDGNAELPGTTQDYLNLSHLTIPRKGMETIDSWMVDRPDTVGSHLTIPRKGMETLWCYSGRGLPSTSRT